MNNCKHTSGYYRYFTATGKGTINYRPDGTEDTEENTDMYQELTLHEQKTKHCLDCDKRLRA